MCLVTYWYKLKGQTGNVKRVDIYIGTPKSETPSYAARW